MRGIDVTEHGRLVVVEPAAGSETLVAEAALGGLNALCSELAIEERVLVVVLTFGTGSPALLQNGPGEALAAAVNALANTPHVTIAVLDRDCVDEELCIAVACDLRIAAADVRLGFPGVAAGAVPDETTVRRLTTMMSRSRVADLLFTGRTISGSTAAEWNLVEETAAEDTAVERAKAVGQLICDGAPLAMRYAKEAVDRGYQMRLQDGLGLEGDLYAILQTTADRMEGITAFNERRPPRYVGE